MVTLDIPCGQLEADEVWEEKSLELILLLLLLILSC